MRILMMITALLLGPMIAYGENPTTAQGVLEIKITNIENGHGTIYIAILDSAEGWLKSDAESKTFRDITQPASSTDDLLISVQDLPPGKYAISLLQALDGDSEMDKNLIGFPKEPFGFSAPMGKFGPPKFEEAAIEFSGENASVEVALN
jgi:uncharacterized protein (DUF2141 family)